MFATRANAKIFDITVNFHMAHLPKMHADLEGTLRSSFQ